MWEEDEEVCPTGSRCVHDERMCEQYDDHLREEAGQFMFYAATELLELAERYLAVLPSLDVASAARAELELWIRHYGHAPGRPVTPQQRRRIDANAAASKAFRRIGERDGFRCRQCGLDRTLTVDHIVPVEFGGTDDDENFQLLCRSHNSAKGTS